MKPATAPIPKMNAGKIHCGEDGPLSFLVSPYEGTESYFREDKGWNYIVFGYDWRRPVTEWASSLEYFLRRLGRRVEQLRNENPLPNTTLLCHSMGGLVAVMFLHRLVNRSGFRPGGLSSWLKQIITVATPFYGTSTHMSRYYKGQSPLNIIYSATNTAQLVGTFPGPYLLLYLDRETYQRDASRLAQSRFPLRRYPMRDAGDDAVAADPYDRALADRYPDWISATHLRQAKATRALLTGRLPQAVLRRIFHIRSGLVNMDVEQRWRNIDGSSFDPEKDNAPILRGVLGPGDGTVPAWSARLAQTPLDQVYDLKNAQKHGDLMEHCETLDVVAKIVTENSLPSRIRVRDETLGVAKASSDKLNRLLAEVANRTVVKEDPRMADREVCRRFIEEAILC